MKRTAFKILIVEDDLQDFELMEAALSAQLPCEVELAMTKSQFEGYLAQKQPDVIVSDSNVVTFDGFTALEIAAGKYPNVPFVFCSGAATEGRVTKNPAKGVCWIYKDKGFASLVAFVKKHLCPKEVE